MIRRIGRARQQGEQGFALIVVILAMLVMSGLTAVMVNNIVSTFNQTSHQMQVTNSLTAADAGLTDMVNVLGQGTPTNWSTFPTSYPGGTDFGAGHPHYYGWNAVGGGQYRAHVDPCSIMAASRITSTGCQSTDVPPDLVVTIQGQYPANTGAVQTIQAVLRNQVGGPAAFNYAMFADKGIQVHHHGDSYVSPTIVTSSIHSNGFITLNYPAIYRVGKMEASGAVTIADGGGSTPSGSVTGPYNWPYWITGSSDPNNPPRCYPALQYPTLYYTSQYWATPSVGAGGYINSAGYNCTGGPQWSPNAVVVGDIQAASVEIKSKGDTQTPSGQTFNGVEWTPEAKGTGCGPTSVTGFQDPVTGACIPDDGANIDAAVVKFDVSGKTYTGKTYTGNSTPPVYAYTATGVPCANVDAAHCNAAAGNTSALTNCATCNQVAPADQGGYIGGQVNLHDSSWAPGSIPFPGLDLSTTGYWFGQAKSNQGGLSSSCNTLSTCHIFSSASTFLTWMEATSGGLGTYAYSGSGNYETTPNPCGYCMMWLDSSGNFTRNPASVVDVVLHGDYFLQGSGNLTLAENTLRSAFSTPSTAPTPTIMVAGALINQNSGINLTASLTVVGPTMDPFHPLVADNTLAQGTQPGLLAAGGTGTAITSTDYDTDSPYTSSSNYQSIYRNQVIVRGLAYSGKWNGGGSSTASDQHWHNADPKNAQIIMGAQIGGTLHDCSNFTFSYDPLIQNLGGFTGSTASSIYVLDWTQL